MSSEVKVALEKLLEVATIHQATCGLMKATRYMVCTCGLDGARLQALAALEEDASDQSQT